MKIVHYDPHAQRRKKAAQIPNQYWEICRDRIFELYIQQNRILEDVIVILNQEGLTCSRRQLVDQLHKWDMRKVPRNEHASPSAETTRVDAKHSESATAAETSLKLSEQKSNGNHSVATAPRQESLLAVTVALREDIQGIELNMSDFSFSRSDVAELTQMNFTWATGDEIAFGFDNAMFEDFADSSFLDNFGPIADVGETVSYPR